MINEAIAEAKSANIVKRIWEKDPAVWTSDPVASASIKDSLGWLTVADEMIAAVDQLQEFAEVTRHRFRYVMVCGMGGSSLCPEVLARTFGRQEGFPELLVLDSTDPDVIAAFRARIEIDKCLFVIASKSGTTTEPLAFKKFWYDEVSKIHANPGENFIAITDPDSPLVETARRLNFQKIFLNQPDIGGRYSALSYFGLAPAALMGLDIRKLLEGARQTATEARAPDNSALRLGVAIGEYARAGRDKLTFVLDPKLATLGLWIEQLIAESTGKQNTGILPVTGEPLGDPSVYGDDRVFVSISLGNGSGDTSMKLDLLEAAGHPVMRRELANLYALGAEFFFWEFATACAGWRLGINPFDQPNVKEAKDATKELLDLFVAHGRLPDAEPEESFTDAVRAQLLKIRPGDYVAFLNYIEETPELDARFQKMRQHLRDATKCATTIGYGPRFLHSTGQLHKGGPTTGVFFQITATDQIDFAVPGESYTFSILKEAQALGDFKALSAHGRRVVRIHFAAEVMSDLDRLEQAIMSS